MGHCARDVWEHDHWSKNKEREREWESGAERNFCAQSETTKEPEGKNFLEDVVVFDSPIYY